MLCQILLWFGKWCTVIIMLLCLGTIIFHCSVSIIFFFMPRGTLGKCRKYVWHKLEHLSLSSLFWIFEHSLTDSSPYALWSYSLKSDPAHWLCFFSMYSQHTLSSLLLTENYCHLFQYFGVLLFLCVYYCLPKSFQLCLSTLHSQSFCCCFKNSMALHW